MHPRRRERAISRLAAQQHGVVTGPQLLAIGLTRNAVLKRVEAGRLHRVHRNVFAVGHPVLSLEGHYLAAVFAGGPGAVLSHRSAAALWDLRPTAQRRIEITVRSPRCTTNTVIQAHRSRTLVPADATRVRGIPCTSIARTLVDLAEVLDRRSLERALEQAEILQLFDLTALTHALARAFGRHGTATLRSALADAAAASPTVTRSELEERFLALCRRARLPAPEVNAAIAVGPGKYVEVDFLWRANALVVETDGHAAHGTRQAFERDRRRDQRLQLAGYRVVRFTWRQVARHGAEVADTVRRLLDRRPD
jgi:very-short-patch-repair endonuclease